MRLSPAGICPFKPGLSVVAPSLLLHLEGMFKIAQTLKHVNTVGWFLQSSRRMQMLLVGVLAKQCSKRVCGCSS